MKKIIFVFVLLSFFSCKKDESSVASSIDFSLLEKFDWQKIEYKEEKDPMDPNTIISYADTTRYSFSGKDFIAKGQQSSILLEWEGSSLIYKPETIGFFAKGLYEVSASDASIILEYIIIVKYFERYGGLGPDWYDYDIEGASGTRDKKKILSLNNQTLKVRSIFSNTPAIPSTEIIETYSAIEK